MKALGVKAALAGDDKVSPGGQGVKAQGGKDQVGSREERRGQECAQSTAHASGRAASRHRLEVLACHPAHDVREIAQTPVKGLHLPRVRPLLRGEDRSGTFRPVERVVHVARNPEAGFAQPRIGI